MVQYRNVAGVCELKSPDDDCKNAAIQEYRSPGFPGAGYTLNFIEFDDEGQLYNKRTEMTQVLARIEQESRGNSDILMVVFVHGWKNNAAFGNGNVKNFRRSLYQLSETEIQMAKVGRRPRRVVGIYLGWRGLSLSPPILKELTFWDRKSTAHKVGRGEVTEVLARLEQIRQRKDAVTHGQSRTRLIVIGHSFGAAVVFSSVEQILEANLARTGGESDRAAPLTGFGNLVVLINPAFEALLYQPLRDLSSIYQSFDEGQLPLLAVLTSEADGATKKLFPLGRWFSTRFEKEQVVERENKVNGKTEYIDEAEANVTAIGHFPAFRTHKLCAAGVSIRDHNPNVSQLCPIVNSEDLESISPQQSALASVATGDAWEQDGPGKVTQFIGSTLTRTDNSAGRDPYMVVQVDSALSRDHNDIWRPELMEFVTQLILLAGQDNNLESRQSERNELRR
jgi:pimeloyl-ACP methyl ester carboxylesterase